MKAMVVTDEKPGGKKEWLLQQLGRIWEEADEGMEQFMREAIKWDGKELVLEDEKPGRGVRPKLGGLFAGIASLWCPDIYVSRMVPRWCLRVWYEEEGAKR